MAVLLKPPRCRSTRTLRHPDGRRAKIRCGLNRSHGTSHAKHVTFVEAGVATVARWTDGGEVVLDQPPPVR